MNIQTLYLRDFRNYETAQLALSPGVNVFCGENAQGKTNILEAVGLLSTTRLFRSGQKRDAVRFGAQQAEVRAAFFAEKRDRTVRAVIPQAGRAQFFVNEVKQKRLSDVTGVLRTVVFCPEDLLLIRESAAARRRFMDIALCQLRPNYARYLSEYGKLHENKLRILKDAEEKPSLLDALDDFSFRMSAIGGHIVRYRAYYLRALMEKAQGIHASLYFGVMAVYGYVTKADLTRIRPVLTFGLVALIVMMLLSLFIPGMNTGMCLVGIVIFLGFTAYDTQMIRRNYAYYSGNPELLQKASIISALQLYLDFINLFLYLLRLFGNRNN